MNSWIMLTGVYSNPELIPSKMLLYYSDAYFLFIEVLGRVDPFTDVAIDY